MMQSNHAASSHSEEFDAQSLPPFNESTQSAEAIASAIASHVKGYNTESQRSASDRTSTISSTKLLSGLASGASEDATGRCLYRNLTLVINQISPLFSVVIQNNFDTRREYDRVCELRVRLSETISSVESEATLTPIVPDTAIFQFRLDVALADKLVELDSSLPIDSTEKGSAKTRQATIDRAMQDLELSMKREQVQAREAYCTAIAAQQNAAARLPLLRAERQSLVIREQFLDSLSSAQRAIITRLNSTLGGDTAATAAHLISIQVKLKGKAILHNQEVVDPLSAFHLPGIMLLLHENYCVESLNYYFDALIEAFNYNMALDEAQLHPDVALSRLVSISNDWHMRGLFERLSQDLLFTCLAVKSVPPTAPFRAFLISETTQYMRRIQSKEIAPTSRTPVFDYVKKLAERFVADQRLQSHPGVATAAATSAAGVAALGSPGGAPKPNRPFRDRRPFNSNNNNSSNTTANPSFPVQLENAALAATAPATPPRAPTRVDCSGQRFAGEVPMSRNLSNNGFPYMAYGRKSGICPQCFPDSGAAVPCPSAPRHYQGQCSRCSFFGHKTVNCLHTHGADGKPLP